MLIYLHYRPFSGGVASRLVTSIYVAVVTATLYDNSYDPNYSNLKYESYQQLKVANSPENSILKCQSLINFIKSTITLLTFIFEI